MLYDMLDMKTVPETLFANPRITDDREAILWEDNWITFGTLRARVRRLANALWAAGVRKGDRVCVLLGNRPEYIECFYAITSIGALIVPLNARLGASEHLTIMVDAGPKVLISSPEYAATIAGATDGVPTIQRVVIAGDAGLGHVGYEEFLRSGIVDAPSVEVGAADDAAIVYTSGTTSLPKGAVLSHDNYLADWLNVGPIYKPAPDGTNLQISPLYHASMMHTYVHLAMGGRTILMKKFDPTQVLKYVEQHHVTHIFCVPTVVYDLLDDPSVKSRDLSSLRSLSYGAAPMSLKRLDEALATFGPILVHAYGLTETTAHSSLLSGPEHLDVYGSVGRPLHLCQMKIVDENLDEVETGELGEIIIRGRNVMSRYWRRPDETARALVDGWFRSGDIGRRDEQGYFFIVDRKKDLIISGGVNIYPKDIEQVIALHEDVGEVAVFGVPDEHWGEAVVAAVRPRPGRTVQEDEIKRFLAGRIGKFQQPKRVVVVDDFPRNGTGKIMKYVLRDQWRG